MKALIPPVTETTAITLATPIMIPSVVKKLRNRLAKIAAKAERELSIREKNISC